MQPHHKHLGQNQWPVNADGSQACKPHRNVPDSEEWGFGWRGEQGGASLIFTMLVQADNQGLTGAQVLIFSKSWATAGCGEDDLTAASALADVKGVCEQVCADTDGGLHEIIYAAAGHGWEHIGSYVLPLKVRVASAEFSCLLCD